MLPLTTHHCPQCGTPLPSHFRHSKLVVCESCGSTIFLEDDAVRLAGKASVLADLPSLLQMHVPFRYQGKTYTPVGQVRYRYQGGFWDEWWVLDAGGEGRWVSVDEGDFAFEVPIHWPSPFPDIREAQVGKPVKRGVQVWEITEKNVCSCEGVRGELPERILPGERMGYLHLSANNGVLVTLEYPLEGEPVAYQGQWVDPFEIVVDA
jgi:DNA-directed RNA polymerase subunit RPC12/RpoP